MPDIDFQYWPPLLSSAEDNMGDVHGFSLVDGIPVLGVGAEVMSGDQSG